MKSLCRNLAAATAALALALTLTGTTAFAFECYNASRSGQGNASAARSAGLISFEEALGLFCGLTPAQAGPVIAQMGALGFKTDFLINGHSLMAGGLEKNGKGEEKLHDGQAIDHLSDEFFGTLVSIAPSCGG